MKLKEYLDFHQYRYLLKITIKVLLFLIIYTFMIIAFYHS